MPREIEEQDRIRLIHMLDAAREALRFSIGQDRAALDSDAMYRRAVISCIQEIGEAAVRVSLDAQAKVKGVPWQQVIGMRHRLVHAYFNVNLDLVYDVLVTELEPLIRQLEHAVEF